MKNIKLYIPKENELDFVKSLLNDPLTMAYNKGYNLQFAGYDKTTGCIIHDISFRKRRYDIYFFNPADYFYAYIYDEDLKAFVGDINFHPSSLGFRTRDIGIVIKNEYRGQGYGKAGLKLLIDKAFSFENIEYLHNNFEKTRTYAYKIHTDLGFRIIGVENNIVDLIYEKKIN